MASPSVTAESRRWSASANVARARYVPGLMMRKVVSNPPLEPIRGRSVSTRRPERSSVTSTRLPATAGSTVPRTWTVSNRRTADIRTVTIARTSTVTGSLTAVSHTARSVLLRSRTSAVSKCPPAAVVSVATTTFASSRSSTVWLPAAGEIVPESATGSP